MGEEASRIQETYQATLGGLGGVGEDPFDTIPTPLEKALESGTIDRTEIPDILDPRFREVLFSIAYEDPKVQFRTQRPIPPPKIYPAQDRRIRANVRGLAPETNQEAGSLMVYRQALWDDGTTHEELFDLYRTLPGFRIDFLNTVEVDRTIGRFMTVPKRTEAAMLRYLAILEDLQRADIAITRNEWNQAMAFAARAYRFTLNSSLTAMLELLSKSERECETPPNLATFNILLDAAGRARDNILFDRVLHEIANRGFDFNRFTYTTIIAHHGRTRNLEGIHETYRQLVESHQIIDNVILNCIIVAFLRAGAPDRAERVYDHMRWLTYGQPAQPDGSYRAARRRAQYYVRMTQLRAYVSTSKVVLQPDSTTYNSLATHYVACAQWDRLHQNIHERIRAGIPMDKPLYQIIMKGFAWHGDSSNPDTNWNRKHAKQYIAEILEQCGENGMVWEKSLAVWVLKAVRRLWVDDDGYLRETWKRIEDQWLKQGTQPHTTAVRAYTDALDSMRDAARNRERNWEERERREMLKRIFGTDS